MERPKVNVGDTSPWTGVLDQTEKRMLSLNTSVYVLCFLTVDATQPVTTSSCCPFSLPWWTVSPGTGSQNKLFPFQVASVRHLNKVMRPITNTPGKGHLQSNSTYSSQLGYSILVLKKDICAVTHLQLH